MLHTATACFSKKFKARDQYGSRNYKYVPIRNNGVECGEDDFMMTKRGEFSLLAVADGVGSWSTYNVDPKIFVTELMDTIKHFYRTINHIGNQHDHQGNLLLKNTVISSMNSVKEKSNTRKELLVGSCTLAVLSLNLRTLHLNSYLIGDVGFVIIRNAKILYKSQDQMKGFNFPYQLGLDNTADSPTDGILKYFKLQPKDIIVIGSDGLFDNVFDRKILKIVNSQTRIIDRIPNKEIYSRVARSIAKILSARAKMNGETEGHIKTPFSKEVEKQFQEPYFGGKNDDTTIMVTIISY